MSSMPIRSSLLLGAVLGASVVAVQPDTPSVKPTAVTSQKQNAVLGEVAAELSKSSAGVAVTAEGAAAKAKCAIEFAGAPFWEALESTAAKTRTRLVLRDGGRSVALEPLAGRPPAVSAVSGPFRVFAREVTGRALLEEGTTMHTVHLTVHWEPRMPVYRIDIHPKVTGAKDDRGTALTVPPRTARDYPTGSRHDMAVEQLGGLTRDSKRIAMLAGEFRAVVAEKMLTVPFTDLAGKFPAEQTMNGVKVTLKTFEKDGETWNAELAMEYPADHPHFDSFEEPKWLRDTRLRLVSPQAKPLDPASEEVEVSGRFVTVTYRFKAAGNPRGKGWSLVCETPGPLREVTVPFALKNIAIP
jgi:hypothetical protein